VSRENASERTARRLQVRAARAADCVSSVSSTMLQLHKKGKHDIPFLKSGLIIGHTKFSENN